MGTKDSHAAYKHEIITSKMYCVNHEYSFLCTYKEHMEFRVPCIVNMHSNMFLSKEIHQ